jgi:hypothetical protein
MTTDIATIAAQLDEAKKDAALWERLSKAPELAKQLTRDLDRAKAAQQKEAATQAKAAQDARFARIGSLRVQETTSDPSAGENLLRRSYSISYTTPVYDMYTMTSLPREHTKPSFEQLPDDIYDCLIDRHPEQIPAAIMDLAPGNPRAALAAYLDARRRGYIKGKAAV